MCYISDDELLPIDESDTSTDDSELSALVAVDSDISSDDDDNNRDNGMRPLPSTDFLSTESTIEYLIKPASILLYPCPCHLQSC